MDIGFLHLDVSRLFVVFLGLLGLETHRNSNAVLLTGWSLAPT